MEWVDGQLVETNGITLKHGRIQAKLEQRFLFTMGEVVSTQVILPGFSVTVDRLLT